jgi:hypothetical protein
MKLNFFFLVMALVGGYLLPTVVAAARGHRRAGWLFLLNVSCGWMPLGYGAALVWAVAGEASGEQDSSNVPTWSPMNAPEDDPNGGEPASRPTVRRVLRVRRYQRGRPVKIEAQERFKRRQSGGF